MFVLSSPPIQTGDCQQYKCGNGDKDNSDDDNGRLMVNELMRTEVDDRPLTG